MKTYKNREALSTGWDAMGNYLTKKKISMLKIRDLLNTQDGSNGSLFIFTGIVRRDKTQNGIVREINYEAYEEMAEKEMEKIKHKASRNFKVNDIVIKHRIGRISVGETSLIVTVLSPHRREGIQAMDYIVNEIKKNVPIWKREIFEDSSYRWI